jgi:acyl-CoA thioesterase FadM
MAVSESVSTPGAPAEKTGAGLAKTMMPVPDPHPDVFDTEWPLRVADVDRQGRLKFDAATRHIQDVGSDQLREMGYEETHPLWIVRRTMVDLIQPIEFKDNLRMRRWCSGTSNRWCEMRVRIDGVRGGGLMGQRRSGSTSIGRLRGRRGSRTTSSRACSAPRTRSGCGGRPT